MNQFELEKFKKLTLEERLRFISKLKEEVKALKKKVLYDEGPVVSDRTFHKSPLRNELEEKIKQLISLETENDNIIKGSNESEVSEE